MAKKKIRLVEDIEVIDLGDKGRAIGRAGDGRIVLVEKAVPGDVITGRVVQRKKGMWITVPEEFHKMSDDRVHPFCDHFGTCGGCKWQNLDYNKQVFYKEKAVADALSRIAHLDNAEVSPILKCENITHYRNKLEYTFSGQRWLTVEEINSDDELNRNALGFHVPGSFARVVDIKKCYLQPDPSDAIRNRIRELTEAQELQYQNIKDRSGLMRNVVIRNNSAGEVMIVLVMIRDEPEARKMIFDDLKVRFNQITSMYYCINAKLNDSTFDLPMHLYEGNTHLRQQLGHVKFDLGPKSFFQTNPAQAEKLYDIAVQMADIGKDDLVFDLYCGIGSISLYVAKLAKHVVGVEEVPEAIDDARLNASLNEIKNIDFFAGLARVVMESLEFRKHGQPDILITDPPRAGMHESVITSILKLAPRRIVYVSCNPSTQARDIKLLEAGYEFIRAQPVDMFPHTSHIENVALLSRKKGNGFG
jgi:23S rRNA (uracil1939-C5)-methyltransferase